MGGGYIFLIDGDGKRRPERPMIRGVVAIVVEQRLDVCTIGQVYVAGLFRNEVFENAEDKDTYAHAI